MDFYVQSRGAILDYYWQKVITSYESRIENEPKIITEVQDLIQSEKPSLVLARRDDKLLLLVTGLKSTTRIDYQGRSIRNSIAWIGKRDDEPALRYQASRILRSFLKQDSLDQKIDEAIKSIDDNGFSVESHDEILYLPAQPPGIENEELDRDRKKQKLESKSDERIRDLANELQNYCLPKQKGALVVVTGIKAKSTLENHKVWRGLADFPPDPPDKNSAPTSAVNFNPIQNIWPQQNELIWVIIALVIVIVVIILNILPLYYQKLFQPYPFQIKPSPLPTESAPNQLQPSLPKFNSENSAVLSSTS